MNSTRAKEVEGGLRPALLVAGIAALAVALGSASDVVFGMVTGADLTALPPDAAGRIAVLIESPLLGLYGLDFLNLVTTLLLVPTYYGCWLLLRREGGMAGLALALGLVATAAFVAVNPALPLWGLARDYSAAGPERRPLLLAAGEAILARGVHGGPGALPAFLLSAIANVVLSAAMFGSRAFGKVAGLLGLVGSLLLGLYLLAVTFLPGVAAIALAAAAPGGLLAIAWLLITGFRLIAQAGVKAGFHEAA